MPVGYNRPVLGFCSCDITLCYLLVLSKTGICFSQSGTFSSRRHPINLGINSHACATMVMLTEWRLPCHFRFVPRRESFRAVCCLADLPELAKKKKKVYSDQSICMSGSDSRTWPAEIRPSVRTTEIDHSSLDRAVVGEIRPCVGKRILLVNARTSESILNYKLVLSKAHTSCQGPTVPLN